MAIAGHANTITINPGSGMPGSSNNVISISLYNELPIRGIQLQIADTLNYLRADSAWTVGRAQDFNVAFNQNSGEPFVTLLLFSTQSITPSDGPIIKLSYSVDSAAPLQTSINLVCSEAILTDENYRSVDVTTLNGVFEIKSFSKVESSTNQPIEYNLAQNYPNPFNPSTHISFGLAQTNYTTLTVYNVLGQQIRSLVNKKLQAGQYEYSWEGIDDHGFQVSAGTYIYQIVSGDYKKTRQLTLVR